MNTWHQSHATMLEHEFMEMTTNISEQLGNLTEIVGNTVSSLASVGSVIATTAPAVGAILMDPATEEKNQAGDRIAEEIKGNTMIASQEATVETTMQQTSLTPGLNTSNQDQSGTMTTMTDRWIKIKETSWTTTQKHFYIIQSSRINYPNDILKIDTVFKSFTHFFAYFHVDIEIMATVTGTKFHQGAISICYAARDDFNSLNWDDASISYRNIRMVPHTILNLQNATSGKFMIPYNNVSALFDRDNRTQRGIICMIPWSPLVAPPGGNATLPVTIFAALKNLKVYGMTKEKTPFSTVDYQRARNMFLKGVRRMEDEGKSNQFIKQFMDTLQRTFPEALAESVGTLNIASHIFNTANINQSESFVQDLSFMGETCTQDPTVTSSTPIMYADLLKIPVPRASFIWDKSSAAGSILWQDQVTVQSIHQRTEVVSGKTVNWAAYKELITQDDLVGNISRFARFWRGSLKYTFEFFNAGMMKGRVKIGILFGEQNYTAENSSYFVTHDLGLEDKVEIVVPYNSWRDWMQVPSTMNWITNKADKYSNLLLKGSSLGSIGVEVVNTLTTTSTMANKLNVLVSISSDNLQLAWPTFSSRHFEYTKGSTGTAWDGKGRAFAVPTTDAAHTRASTYPECPQDGQDAGTHFMYGDMPLSKDLEYAESFIGSFGAQSDVTAGQPELPTTAPFRTSYIGNHVEIASLMTRPALAAHATVWVAQNDSNLTGNKTFSAAGLDGIILVSPDNTGIAEIGMNVEKNAKLWPWDSRIRPQEHQQDICALGTYWSGSAKLNIAISDIGNANIKLVKGVVTGTMAATKAPSNTTGPLLFLTFGDEAVLTTKDLLMNGAYCINTAQQKMATFNIPYYMIEQQKRLNGSDLSWRLFVQTRNEITFDIHVWISWGEDFKLYFPTLIPTRKQFGGVKVAGVSDRSYYYYARRPSNWNYFPHGSLSAIEDEPNEEEEEKVEPNAEGNVLMKKAKKYKCSCKVDGTGELDLDIRTPMANIKITTKDEIDNTQEPPPPPITNDGDIESNPGPECVDCGITALQFGACGCAMKSMTKSRCLAKGIGNRGKDLPYEVADMLYDRYNNKSFYTLNDITNKFTNHDIKYDVTRKYPSSGPVIEVIARIAIYDKGICVYWNSAMYVGKPETGIKQALRRKLMTNWHNIMKERYPGFYQMLEMLLTEDFRAEGLFDSIKGTVTNMVNKLTDVSDSILTSISVISNAKEIFDDARKRVYIFFAKVLIHIANVLINPIKSNFLFTISLIGLDLASLPGFSSILTKIAISHVESIFQLIQTMLEPEPIAEGLSDVAPQIGGLISLIFVTILGVTTTGSDLANCVKSVCSNMKTIGTTASGIRGVAQLVDMFWKVTTEVLNYFKDGFTMEERSVLWFSENKEKVFVWETQVLEMETTYVKGITVLDEAKRAEVHALFDFGKEIQAGCLMAKETSHLFAKLRASFMKVSKWHQDLLHMKGVFKMRPEPVVTYLYGEPGQGKSIMATKLAQDMCSFMGTDEDNYYSLPPGFKHMDNYAQQPVVIIDDIGQASDDEDWKIFCQMVSTTPFVPPMADLADKGMAFTSPIIICTSNSDQPQPATIKYHEAIWRRLKNKIEVTANRNYIKEGKLDFPKAIKDDTVEDMTCMDLKTTDDWHNKAPITYKDLLTNVKQELVNRRVNVEKMNTRKEREPSNMEEMLDQARAEGKSFGVFGEYRPMFELCTRCDGKKSCILCENIMRINDDFPIVTTKSECKKAIEQTEEEFMRHQDLILINDIKMLLEGKFSELYWICVDDGDVARYYLTLDGIRQGFYRILYKKTQLAHMKKVSSVVKWTEAIAAVVSIAMYIGFIGLAWKGISWWMTASTEVDAYQSATGQKMKPSTTKTAKVGTAPKVHGASTLVEDAIIRNQEYATFYAGGMACTKGMITFLDSRTIITCKHMLVEPEDQKLTHIRIEQGDSYTDIPYNVKRVTQVTIDERKVDLVVITLPVPFMGKKRITHLFVTKEQFGFTTNARLHLLTKKGHQQRTVEAQKPFIYKTTGQYKDTYSNVYQYDTIIRYPMTDRGPGDSGGLITTLHTATQGKVFGMHVAGTPTYGMALPLYRELVEELILITSENDEKHIESPMELDVDNEAAHVYPNVDIKVKTLGNAPIPILVARKSDYKPSPIHGEVFPVLRAPAALKVNDKRTKTNKGDPLWNMTKKYAQPTGYVDEEFLEESVEHCSNVVNTHSIDEPIISVLTMDVAINGMEVGETMEQIPMGTSPGYPFSQVPRVEKGKLHFFEEQGEKDGKMIYDAVPQLKERIKARELEAKQRKRISESYFQTALKNELRTLNKVETNKARTIEGCPLDYLLLFRQYFGSFCNWQTKNYGTLTGSCVGCNPDIDWTHFYHELKDMGDEFIAVDFTNWDGSVPAQYLYAALRIINNFYEAAFRREHKESDDDWEEQKSAFEQEQNVRATLYDELAVTISVVGDQLILTINGLPSGHPMTAILNCLIHWLKMNVAYLEATIEIPEKHSLAFYEKHHKSLFYGDDGITALSKEIVGIFDRFDLAKTSAKEGMTCTMEDKEAMMTAYSSIEEVSYLKRKFLPNECDAQIICAPIELRTIGSLLNWIRDAGSFEQNIEDAMWFLYHHGSKVYTEYKGKINAALAEVGLNMTLLTWKQQFRVHQVKFGKLDSEWRTRPVIPQATMLLSRAIAGDSAMREYLNQTHRTIKQWTPYFKRDPRTDHLCDCGAIVFAKSEGKCYRCLNVKDIPSWYFYEDRSWKDVKRIEEHHLGDDGESWHFAYLRDGTGPGKRSPKHHTCGKCNKVYLHLTMNEDGRVCLPCIGIPMPKVYGMMNKDLLKQDGDVESNPGPYQYRERLREVAMYVVYQITMYILSYFQFWQALMFVQNFGVIFFFSVRKDAITVVLDYLNEVSGYRLYSEETRARIKEAMFSYYFGMSMIGVILYFQAVVTHYLVRKWFLLWLVWARFELTRLIG